MLDPSPCFLPQQVDQNRVIALILIGDEKRDDAVIGGAGFFELLADMLAVVALHRHDQLCPCDKIGGQRIGAIGVHARRPRLDPVHRSEQVFGGRASQLVGGADKQDFHDGHVSLIRAACESIMDQADTDMKARDQAQIVPVLRLSLFALAAVDAV